MEFYVLTRNLVTLDSDLVRQVTTNLQTDLAMSWQL